MDINPIPQYSTSQEKELVLKGRKPHNLGPLKKGVFTMNGGRDSFNFVD